jgi:hypothetical protein
MATTIPTLTASELRERLSELQELAESILVAEKELRKRASALARCDWEWASGNYANAVQGELSGVYELLVRNPLEDGLDVEEVVSRVVDTIDVVDLVIRRAQEADDAR